MHESTQCMSLQSAHGSTKCTSLPSAHESTQCMSLQRAHESTQCMSLQSAHESALVLVRSCWRRVWVGSPLQDYLACTVDQEIFSVKNVLSVA